MRFWAIINAECACLIPCAGPGKQGSTGDANKNVKNKITSECLLENCPSCRIKYAKVGTAE